MDPLHDAFHDRLREIEAYLDLLDTVEAQARSGPPKLFDKGVSITAEQQKILYSGVYLQLYSLVEATVTRCVDALCVAATNGKGWRPSDLSEALKKEWVRSVARTHVDLNHENRLARAMAMFELLVQSSPMAGFKVEKGVGNWDDSEIETISKRLGLELRISDTVRTGVKRHVRDDKGPLALIRDLRNRLAHGGISFVECGEGATVGDLRALKDLTAAYLGEVVASFSASIAAHEYLLPERRPAEMAV